MSDVLVVGCDPGSDGWCALLAHALVAFFGDGTCSAENTHESCFGAEWCDRSLKAAVPTSFVANLMRSNECHVALDARRKTFLGVAAVSPLPTMMLLLTMGIRQEDAQNFVGLCSWNPAGGALSWNLGGALNSH